MKESVLIILSILFISQTQAQTSIENFYIGNDLSYVNMMEDCGADFKEGGISKDVYQIYADHGNRLVRVRLWVNPNWQKNLEQPDGVKEIYSNLEDVKETIQRAKSAGMEVLLDFHYSDFWADPGRQVLPNKWYIAGTNENTLADTVYNYTFRVLNNLNNEGLLPEMVQIGNENNSGIMTHRSMNNEFNGQEFLSNNWGRHAKLFNAGIKATRDISDSTEKDIKIALHYAGVGGGLEWRYGNAISNGITDFDIIGFSYYPAYHGSSISGVGNQVARLKNDYPNKEIIILETGYPWTSQNFDGAPNIITDIVNEYTPLSPIVQQRYLVELTKAVMNAGGNGVIFWESAWVSTSCRTPWAQGSAHDHVAFFDYPDNNFIELGAGNWMQAYIYEDMQSLQTVFRVDMKDEDISNGVYLASDFDGNGEFELDKMHNEVNKRYAFTKYISQDNTGEFFFINGNDLLNREVVPENCSNSNGNRSYEINSDNLLYDFIWGTCDRISDSGSQTEEIKVTFAVDMTGINVSNGVYVTGDFTEDSGGNWSIEQMEKVTGQIYKYEAIVAPNTEGGWYFLNSNSWGNREVVPTECVGYYTADRGYFIEDEDIIYAYEWGSCNTFELVDVSVSEEEEVPKNIQLFQNYPNPFNPSTLITYEIIKASVIELSLFNMLGQKVMTIDSGFKSPGKYRIELDAGDLPSGNYVYRIVAGGFTESKQLMLLK